MKKSLKNPTTTSLLKDLDTIFKTAMVEGNLAIALKAKELQHKITQNDSSPHPTEFNITDLSDADLAQLIKKLT